MLLSITTGTEWLDMILYIMVLGCLPVLAGHVIRHFLGPFLTDSTRCAQAKAMGLDLHWTFS